jgi:hypothetical protein
MRKLLVGLSAALLASASAPAFAQVPTTNYGWLKPTIGASANTWGNNLNGDLDGIDSTVFSVSGVANAACPKAGCAFTGGITGTMASFSSTLGVTGGATLNGGLTVSGLTTHNGGALGTTSGNQVEIGRFNYTSTNSNILRIYGARNANGSDWTTSSTRIQQLIDFTNQAYIEFNPPGFQQGIAFGAANSQAMTISSAGTVGIGGSLNVSGTANIGTLNVSTGGANISGGLTLNSGTLTLPAASVANADLDAVNGAPGSCGSTTTTCTFTTNAQGRITAQGSATLALPSCSGSSTSGYCNLGGGYVHQWYHYDSGGNFWSGGPQSITFPFSPSHGCYSYSAVTDNQGGVASPYYALQITSAPGGNSVTVQAAGFQSGSRNAIEGFYVTADCY